MVTLLSIPFELQQHILENALPLELCRSNTNGLDEHPLDVFQRSAIRIFTALPTWREYVIELCSKHPNQRQQEHAELNAQCYTDVNKALGRDCCFDPKVSCTSRHSPRCAWCREIQKARYSAQYKAGSPFESSFRLNCLVLRLRVYNMKLTI